MPPSAPQLGVDVGHGADAKVTEPIGLATDDDDRVGDVPERLDLTVDDATSVERQAGFVSPAHAGSGPPARSASHGEHQRYQSACMSEPRIGRVLVASLHQAIADVLPSRLEFYENWLSNAGLREGHDRSGAALCRAGFPAH